MGQIGTEHREDEFIHLTDEPMTEPAPKGEPARQTDPDPART
jgi:hypothetical protein